MSAIRDDWDLFRDWRGGDSSAGDELLMRYFEVLIRFFHTKVRAEDVGDLVAETFLEFTSSIDRFEPGGNFKALLFAIAMNKVRQYYSKQVKRRRESDDFELACAAELALPTPESLLSERDELRVLVRALRRLSLIQQAVVELNYFEGLPGPAIGELLGLPLATVYTHLRRGKARLASLVRELSDSPQLAESTMMGLETWARQIRTRVATDTYQT